MDEVDGRPGDVALQSGHPDALADVLDPSLCPPHPASRFTVILSLSAYDVILSEDRRGDRSRRTRISAKPLPKFLNLKEIHHENLPGK
jgi:hypothetical protein